MDENVQPTQGNLDKHVHASAGSEALAQESQQSGLDHVHASAGSEALALAQESQQSGLDGTLFNGALQVLAPPLRNWSRRILLS